MKTRRPTPRLTRSGRLTTALTLAAFLTLAPAVSSAFAGKDEASRDKKPEGEKKELITVAEAIKDNRIIDGLFPLYQNTDTGRLRMLLRPGHFDHDFIYFTFTTDAAIDAGHHRGCFRDNRVFRFRRLFERVVFVAENTAFHFDPENPLSRAAGANRPAAVLGVVPIVAQDKDSGEVVVDADVLFLKETLAQIRATPDPKTEKENPTRFSLGELDEDRTKPLELRNYPQNTDVVVEYVYTNPQPHPPGGPNVTDPRYVSILVQHSLIAAPENNYTARFDDPRVGYFTNEVTEMTTTRPAPYRDMIQRWNLQKIDPAAEISEPVEPIVFWMENTSPHELRDIVRDAALAWNPAFEAAGFKNAIRVEMQPDDADWDANDIRYNVIRWISSARPLFGGHGPSFADPRTGQILGADIVLDFAFVTNRVIDESIHLPPTRPGASHCSLAAHRQADLQIGIASVRAQGLGVVEERRLIREGVYEERAFVGQAGFARAFSPVPETGQRRAMQVMRTHVFAPDAFFTPENTVSLLQRQRRGFHASDEPTEPRIHTEILKIQSAVLDHLLHARTLARITDSRSYGNTYSATDMGHDLTAAIFEDDRATGPNTTRQNLQIEYVGRLVALLDPKKTPSHDHVSRSMALQELVDIRSSLADATPTEREHRAHAEYLRHRITRALEDA